MKNEDFLIKLSKIIISFNENNNDLKNNQLFNISTKIRRKFRKENYDIFSSVF